MRRFGVPSHPLLGLRTPHLELVTGSRKTSSTQELHAGRGVLLDLEDNAVLRGRASGWSDRVDIVTAAPHGLQPGSPLTGTSAVLVRPDGYVARAAPGSHHDLPMALERWFGPSRI